MSISTCQSSKRRRIVVACAALFATATLIPAGNAAPADQPGERTILGTRANTFTYNHQMRPAIDVDEQGRIFVAWASRRQVRGTFGVFGQWFDPLGRPLGTETLVNQFYPNTQHEPDVAVADGRAWVVWESLGQDGDGAGVYLRRFAVPEPGATGYVALSDEQRVNETTARNQMSPSVAVNHRGEALVCWTHEVGAGRFVVLGRLYDSEGSPISGEFRLSSGDAGAERHVACAALGDGRFVAVWDRFDAAGRPAGIVGATIAFAQSGPLVGEAFDVSMTDGQDHIEPSVSADASGRFAVTWMRSREDGAGYDVLARLFDSETNAGEPIVVADEIDGWKNGAAAAMHPDGRFMIAWNVEFDALMDTDSNQQRPAIPADVFARHFDESGRPVGERLRANHIEEGHQTMSVASNSRRIAFSAIDTLVFAWNGNTGDDRRSIGLSIHAPTDYERPAPPPVEPVPAGMGVTPDDIRVPPEFDPFWVEPEPDAFIAQVGPDFGFQAFLRTPWNPPDPDLAVGPEHIVAVVNMHMAVYTKDGTRVFDQLLEDFFRDQGANYFVFDPIAAWDPIAERFVIATTEHNSHRAGNVINIAVTKTDNPLDGWHKYSFNCDPIGDFIDFPNLGIGTDAYYVTVDYFRTPRGNHIHIFEKAPMLVGAPVEMKTVRTSTGTRSLGAVKTYDADATVQYFATSFSGSSTAISIDAIRNATTTPIRNTMNLTVPSYANPPGATQRGSSNRVSTVDRRIKAGVYRDGRLWLVHTIGQDSTARVRWYEVDPRGWPDSGLNPILVQSGTFNYGSGEHIWFPDIGVDADGNAVIVMNCSSANDYIYIARAVRRGDDPTGTFRDRVRLQESTSPEPSSRWGDYSGVCEDPAAPGVFWSHTQYRTSDWRTWVGRIDANRTIVLDAGPFTAGQPATMTASNCAPNADVAFVYSLDGVGSQYVGVLNVTLELHRPQLAGVATANSQGVATLIVPVPRQAPARDIWVQAAEYGNLSNLVETVIVR